MESTLKFDLLRLFKLLIFLAILRHSPLKTTASSTPLLPKEALPTMSDYLTVNSTMGSTIYYSFYEAQEPSIPLSQTPIPICLQDGPECSSMFGNFYQPGPWRLSTNISRKPNLDSWNRIFGFLVLDNLIGFGLSIVSSLKKFQEINMMLLGILLLQSGSSLNWIMCSKLGQFLSLGRVMHETMVLLLVTIFF